MAGLNRVALVSGAASGIGLQTARELVRQGWTVYGGFRPGGRNAPAASAGIAVPLDVTDTGARAAAVETIQSTHGRLDALINSAGVNATGALDGMPERVLRQVMEINFFGAIGLTRDCLPLMRKTGGGTVVMLSSLSALIGLPCGGAYAASKYALEGATESLRYEVEKWGIRVSLIRPGAYATALADVSSGTPRVGAGGDPREVAMKIVETLLSDSPPLQIACGSQAEAVFAQLRTLNEAQRREFAYRIAGTDVGTGGDVQKISAHMSWREKLEK